MGDVVAAVDCGTNTIRLLIAELTVRDGAAPVLRDLHRESRIVRLGEGVDATKQLAPQALSRTWDALTDYAALIREHNAERVRMVATSATRDATNRAEFFGMTREVLGVQAEVISGDEEAQLSFVGAVSGQSAENGPFLVVDLGGGSTELVLGNWDGRDATVLAGRSANIGSVRITERALKSDPPTKDEIDAASQLATDIFAPTFAAVDVAQARTWIGVAGTISTLSAIALGLSEYDSERVQDSRLSKADIDHVTKELLAADYATRAANPVIEPGRVDVIAGGSLIVQILANELAQRGGPADLVVSNHDILDGIALSLSA